MRTIHRLIVTALIALSVPLAPALARHARHPVRPHRRAHSRARRHAVSHRLISLTPLRGRLIPRFALFELAFHLPRYHNPFDSHEVRARCWFRDPDGRGHVVDGFYYQGYTRTLENGREVLTASGVPQWRVRFTPTLVGRWTCKLSVDDHAGHHRSAPLTFQVVPDRTQPGNGARRQSLTPPPIGNLRGFVRVRGTHFAFDDGTQYFPIGENLAWAGPSGTYSYDVWMRRLARDGANWVRVWCGSSPTFTIEKHRFVYNLRAAWRLDHVLRTAERDGIHVQICAESFNALRIRPGPALWKMNPWNKACGGFLQRPADFFTDLRAKEHFAERLRYLVARYGYSPGVSAWELMNEVDLTEGFNVNAVKAWCVTMARVLHTADPNHHPVTISFGTPEGIPEIDRVVDFAQIHLYGAADISSALGLQCRERVKELDKPVLATEVGASVYRHLNELNDGNLWVHDALWTPLFNGGAGAGMPWWWDSVIDMRHHYGEFAPVSRFASAVDWNAHTWNPVRVLTVRYQVAPPRLLRDDVLVTPPQGSWQLALFNRPVAVVIPRDGQIADDDVLSRLLHGTQVPSIHNSLSFLVDYPVDGQFIMHIIEPPPRGAQLRVTCDGTVKAGQRFTGSEVKVPISLSIPVEAGEHTISVENSGTGTLNVDYELPGYREIGPDLRVSGMGDDHYAVIRVQNRDHSWLRGALGLIVRPVQPSIVVLGGFQIGDYEVDAWNTHTGTSIPGRQRCVDGHIELHVPYLHDDVAYVVRRLRALPCPPPPPLPPAPRGPAPSPVPVPSPTAQVPGGATHIRK